MNKINKGVLIIMLLAVGISANAQNTNQGDSAGIGMAIIAMIAIFIGLILFHWCSKLLPTFQFR
jgi:hypothetical protein